VTVPLCEASDEGNATEEDADAIETNEVVESPGGDPMKPADVPASEEEPRTEVVAVEVVFSKDADVDSATAGGVADADAELSVAVTGTGGCEDVTTGCDALGVASVAREAAGDGEGDSAADEVAESGETVDDGRTETSVVVDEEVGTPLLSASMDTRTVLDKRRVTSVVGIEETCRRWRS